MVPIPSVFDNIPQELLDKIASALPLSSLAALSAACKPLYFRILPLLYESISLQFYTSECGRGRELHLLHSPVHLFFRTVRQRPLLGTYVKSSCFDIRQTKFHGSTKIVCNKPSPDLCDIWNGLVRELALPFSQKLEADIQLGHPSAFIALLLTQLPNLEKLRLGYGFFQESKQIADMLEFIGSEPLSYRGSRFSSLKEIYVQNDIDGAIAYDDDATTKANRSFLDFPSLELLDIIVQEPRDKRLESVGDKNSKPLLPHLKTLRLTDNGVSMNSLAFVLSTVPSLTTFDYFRAQNIEALKFDRTYRHHHTNHWQLLTSTLSTTHSHTLKHLTIAADSGDIDEWPPHNMDRNWVSTIWLRQGSLSSLSQFTALQNLEAPIAVLLGWYPDFLNRTLRGILPPSLRHLTLNDDLSAYNHTYKWTTWHRKHIEATPDRPRQVHEFSDSTPIFQQLRDYLLPAAPHHKPLNLRSLRLRMREGQHWNLSQLRILEQICREARVLCIVYERMKSYRPRCDRLTGDMREMVIYDPSDPNSGSNEFWEKPDYPSRYYCESTKRFFY
ncbi:hypothetical protein AJ79_02920 [Helicocarpus griseus UAMH5409]|uniref:F-box domain-containing protein n=1 Tax=Helicocarpus griseus UAMH5409 TaxID=1447875 RepID=A0A2B7Y063_9EURO|nr:hypothetical protein AJ79_02920 [Helicocarpus griseus UAMH5409]